MQMYQQSKKNILLLRKSNNSNNNNNDNKNNNNTTKGLTFELGPQNRSPAVHKAETSLQHGSTSQQKLHAIQNIKHFGLKIAKRLKIHLGDRQKKNKNKTEDYSLYKSSIYITSGVAFTFSMDKESQLTCQENSCSETIQSFKKQNKKSQSSQLVKINLKLNINLIHALMHRTLQSFKSNHCIYSHSPT